MADALEKVKAELGREAVILHTRTFRRGGLLGVGARRVVEITASRGTPESVREQKNTPASRDREGAVFFDVQGPLPYGRGSETASLTPSELPTTHGTEDRETAYRSRSFPNAALLQAQGTTGTRHTECQPRSVDRQDITTFASGLQDEMNEIRSMVRELLNRPAPAPRSASADDPMPDAPEALQAYYTRLLQNEVAEEVAREVMAMARDRLDQCRERIQAGVGDRIEGAQRDQCVQEKLQALVPAVLTECIERMLPGSGPVKVDTQTTPKVVALVGPTGVGKTTTIAKLAAHFKLRENKKVALITIDTYRIAAVEQLRAYADIMSLPLEVVFTPDELAEAIGRLRDCDLLLLDTSGRSHRDTRRLDELRTFLDVARSAVEGIVKPSGEPLAPGAGKPMEVHLLLSCTCHPDQLLDVAEKFSGLGVDRAVFTKLDEAVGLGVVLNVASKLNWRLSYLTTGQDVPDDIEVGHRRRIAERLLKDDAAEPLPRRVLAEHRSAMDHLA